MPIWIIIVEWLARLVLLGLVVLSIWSIAIISNRKKYFQAIQSDIDQLDENLSKQNLKDLAGELQSSGVLRDFIERIVDSPTEKKVERAARIVQAEKRKEMEQGLLVLGTLGSTTPFIGLFGTILGIIVAFGSLSIGQIDSKQVMYVLAEALVLTAAGLVVAIPAVIAFNYFNGKIKMVQGYWTRFKRPPLAQLERVISWQWVEWITMMKTR